MRLQHHSAFLLSMGLAACAALAGCSNGLNGSVSPAVLVVTGNWQISSSSSAAQQLPVLTGSLQGTSEHLTGVFHTASVAGCTAASTPVTLTGNVQAGDVTQLSGPLAGGTLLVTGILAANGRSLSAASYSVRGGTCNFTAPAVASVQQYADVTGNYAGIFTDAGGNQIPISSSLSQSPQGDGSGNFQLSGSATLPANGCFASPVNISASQVTGGSFTVTYQDAVSGNSVTAQGTFSPDSSTLTVTGWQSVGPCGGDSGTGSQTRQP